jgi:hypothetical protein
MSGCCIGWWRRSAVVNDPDPRLMRAVRQLDQERIARRKAEQQTRALRLANDRLRATVRVLTADRASRKPPAT